MYSFENERIKKKIHFVRIIAIAMLTAVIIGAPVLEVVNAYDMISIQKLADSKIQLQQIVLFVMIAVMYLVMSMTVNRIRIASLDRAVSVSVVFLSLSESVAIPGLILFLLSGETVDYHIFAGASLLFFLKFWPRKRQWKNWLQKEATTAQVREDSSHKSWFCRIKKESADRWIYMRTGPVIRIISATIFFMVFLMAVAAMRAGIPTEYYPAFILMGLPFMILVFFKSGCEISPSHDLVRKWWQLFKWRKQVDYRISSFNCVKIESRVGSRYGLVYTVVLHASDKKIEVFRNTYKEEAFLRAKELAKFVNLPLEGENAEGAVEDRANPRSRFAGQR